MSSSPLLSPRHNAGKRSTQDHNVPTVVVSLEAVQSEKLRADLAESLLQGTQEALQQQLSDTYETLRAETLRADIAESILTEMRQEAEQLREVGQVHAEVAAEATRRAEACETVKKRLMEELDHLSPSAAELEGSSDAASSRASKPRASTASSMQCPQGDYDPPLQAQMPRTHSHSRTERTESNADIDDNRSEHRSLPTRELYSMVQASAEEVLRTQIDLGLEKQKNAKLDTKVRELEKDRDSLKNDVIELQGFRVREKELRAMTQASVKEAERLWTDLSTSKHTVSELSRALQNAVRDRDQLAQELAETSQQASDLRESEASYRKSAQALEHETRQLRSELNRLRNSSEGAQKELADMRELLASKREQSEKLSDDKRMLEAEFKTYREYYGTGDQHQLKAIAKLEFTVDQLNRQVESTKTELGAQQSSTEHMRSHINSLEEQNRIIEQQRRELHNTVQELKGNIRVYCRVRPLPDCGEVSLALPEPNKMNLTHGDECYTFGFDKVFGMDALQAEVYEEVDGLIQSALDGYKVCIFAYGQTGSGKTYTMQGTDEPGGWGLIPRSLSKIFQTSQKMIAQGWSWSLQVSILEVYNENLRDLLRGGGDNAAGPATPHTIQHHEAWGTIVTNVTCIEVSNMEQIDTLMQRAAKQRSVGATEMNAVSSRSHSIFALYLKGMNSSLGHELYGALHLVDLCGSERLDKSLSSGDRLKETQSINKSLSSLADVFVAKAEGRMHVPFRNSKLTYLMEPCLSGQGKTVMLVNVRPESSNSHETLCSLRFAKQVNQCDTGGKPRRYLKSTSSAGQPKSPPAATAPMALAAPTSTMSQLPKTPRGRSRTFSRDCEPCSAPVTASRLRSPCRPPVTVRL